MNHDLNPHRTLGIRRSRRAFLARSGMGFASVALGGLASASPELRHAPPFAPRAKRVIHLFMNGGPSHIDSFDPKPALARWHGKMLPNRNLRTENETGAAFASPFEFKRYGQSGLPISSMFPEVAKHADDLCVVRSMVSDEPFHDQAILMMHCGDNRLVRPSMGAWLTYGLGHDNENLPGFVAMSPGPYPGPGRSNWRSAFLPNLYQGTYIGTRDTRVEKLVENIKSQNLIREEQERQLAFVRSQNRRHLKDRPGDPVLEARIAIHEQAFRMQFAATDVLDLSNEPESVRQLYGDTVHGRQLLLARRLAERGVRFLQVWYGYQNDWDSHSNIEKNHGELAAKIDRPIAALLTDLKQRGLLDETLVIWGGQFGRTPTVELPSNGVSGQKLGRDHNPYGFSMWMAGGGVRGGMVYGSTDEFGFVAEENPVHIHDLHATILYVMGLDHERLTYRYAGRDFRLTDVHGHVVKGILG